MPAIPASGAISLTDFATEFGGTAPHSMSEYYRNGANVPSNNSNVPTTGAFRFGHMRGAINEIILAATSGANVDISGLFGANWTSTVPKRLTVPAGVTIGGTGSSAALIIPANMAGTLEIDNAGSILGFGGAANGGSGGNAIQNLASGVTINNTGLLAGGGGGGGLGGTGGNGSSETVTYRSYHSSNYWQRGGRYNIADNEIVAAWSGSLVINVYGGGGSYPSSITSYGSYRRGSFFSSSGKTHYYGIGQASTTSTTGGAGGAGGVGQGYNQSNTSGSGGSSGGTNAGTGGTGGSGSAYGTAGSTGATGANGNSSNGIGGSSGGAAGAAVTGTSVSMNNTGTLYGAVA